MMSKPTALANFAMLAVAVGACVSEAKPPPAATSDIVPSRAYCATAAEPRTLDEEFAELACVGPGFAGMYRGADGETLHILVKDDTPERRAAVERAVASFFEAIGGLPPTKVQFVPAEYDFLELKEWYDRSSRIILAMPDVVSTDIDEVKNRIDVGVENRDARAAVEQRLDDLDVPEGMVIIEIVAPVVED